MKEDPYKKSARIYDIFVEPFNKALRQIGMGMYPPVAGMNVLDVGCGTGTTLNHYQKAGCNVFGIDSSPAMLSVSKNKLCGRAELLLGDATKMEYPSDFFDMVIAMLTLHEMPDIIRSKVFDEMMRVLKKEGRILIIDYHPSTLKFPKGWMNKSVIFFFEIVAGFEHFNNFRNFIATNGIFGLAESRNLNIEKAKIVSGGNLGIYVLRTTKHFSIE
jgi:ubiquinone/menaquinone biosynthesis C-methylase UbiE